MPAPAAVPEGAQQASPQDPHSALASSYRPRTATWCFAFACCVAGLLTSARAIAQETKGAPLQIAEKSSAIGCAVDVQAKFLRVEPKFIFLMHVGNEVTQNGKVLDQGLSFLIPESAVHGSKTAMVHLSHARMAHAATVAAFMTTFGLLVGAEIIRQQHDGRWTNSSSAMGLGGVVTLVSSFVFAHLRDWETFAAVNSYNQDLVSGRLDR